MELAVKSVRLDLFAHTDRTLAQMSYFAYRSLRRFMAVCAASIPMLSAWLQALARQYTLRSTCQMLATCRSPSSRSRLSVKYLRNWGTIPSFPYQQTKQIMATQATVPRRYTVSYNSFPDVQLVLCKYPSPRVKWWHASVCLSSSGSPKLGQPRALARKRQSTSHRALLRVKQLHYVLWIRCEMVRSPYAQLPQAPALWHVFWVG